jgi:hypothetical protein
VPNGKRGDHWWTDIASHGRPTFSPQIDAIIAEFDARVQSDESSVEAWQHPLRLKVEQTVEQHLDAIGYPTLEGRGETAGMDYRKLTPDELSALEAKLKALRDAS